MYTLLITNYYKLSEVIMKVGRSQRQRDENSRSQRQRDENGEWERFLRERFLRAVQPGDQIFCKRSKGKKYHHHGIYMGDSMVIHLRRKSSVCKFCDSCKYIPALRCGRTLSCLDCFRANEMCYIVRYRKVEPSENLSEETRNRLRPGKAIRGYNSKQIYLEILLDGELYCHLKISKKLSRKYTMEDSFELSRFSTSKSAAEVVKTALEDGPGFKSYNLLMNNCEDFAVFCKTGKTVSVQVHKRFRRILPFGIGSSIYKAVKCINQFCIRREIQKELHECLQNYYPPQDQPSIRSGDLSVEIKEEESLLLDSGC